MLLFHRITEFLRLEGTSGDCLLQPHHSKQGQPEQVSQDLAQSGTEYLYGWRLHSLSMQPVPVIHNPLNREVFSFL